MFVGNNPDDIDLVINDFLNNHEILSEPRVSIGTGLIYVFINYKTKEVNDVN